MPDVPVDLDAVLVGGRRPVPVELSEPDPGWPQAFSAHRDRILAALSRVNLVATTPMQAMNALFALQEELATSPDCVCPLPEGRPYLAVVERRPAWVGGGAP
jgi:hypothetical protein